MEKRQRFVLLGVAAAVAIIAIVIAVASGGSDKKDSSTSTTATTAAPGATSTAADRPPQPEQITLKGGQPDGGVKKLSFDKDGPLDIVVTSDQKLPIHFHGYDIEKETAPGKPAEFKVAKANIDGVFEMEVESTSTKIASITVR